MTANPPETPELDGLNQMSKPTDTNQATDDTQKAPTRTLSEQHAQHGTATSPIISDTNQASEDGLQPFTSLTKLEAEL